MFEIRLAGAFICFQFDGIRMEKQDNSQPAVQLQTERCSAAEREVFILEKQRRGFDKYLSASLVKWIFKKQSCIVLV